MSSRHVPVLVGASQLVFRDQDPAKAPSPLDTLEAVARGAAADAHAGERVLAEVDTLAVVEVAAWRGTGVPQAVAERIGATPARHVTTGTGGELPIALVNRLASEIAQGSSRVALVVGSNQLATFKRARAAGIELDLTPPKAAGTEMFGTHVPGSSELEEHYGLESPPTIYPIFENALRARRGLDFATHRARVGELMSGFTRVAAKNPYAWYPIERSAEEITTPTPDNRMIAFPYTKYLNAVLYTDQVAGVLLMSLEAARSHGIPEDRLVYWWGGAEAQERAWYASERPDFASCPALRAAVGGALARAGVGVEDVDLIDFYSCFPVAVEMACEMLGVDETDPRGLSLTGGLPYHGGPGNNYTIHSLAVAMDRLREGAGGKALVTGNGWYLTKHSGLVLAREPREGGVEAAGPADVSSAPAPLSVVPEVSGPATVETYTVLYARDGAPARGIVLGRTEAGQRFVANTPDDRDTLEAFVAVENVGRSGRVSFRDGRNRFEPA
jgi:acetyl-CoA C-acetyltransferase